MAYFLVPFTPETWLAFRERGANVTGFRKRQQGMAKRVNRDDIFLCYLTVLSRWCGVLQVESESYLEETPIQDALAPFIVRFKVKPIVTLDAEKAIPIYEDEVWNTLTLTKGHQKGASRWTGPFRMSLNKITEDDGRYLLELLKEQQANPKPYPLASKGKAPAPDGQPDDESRESTKYQAKVAKIGATIGFKIWVPKNNRNRVLDLVPPPLHQNFLNELPLSYAGETLRTVEDIDVLWIEEQAMARAFEIEHTTAIYSGLLRMADLLALQPNMDIRLHIVAPPTKRDKVLREIRRPVFRPVRRQCSYLSYDKVDALLAENPHLDTATNKIVEKYGEPA